MMICGDLVMIRWWFGDGVDGWSCADLLMIWRLRGWTLWWWSDGWWWSDDLMRLSPDVNKFPPMFCKLSRSGFIFQELVRSLQVSRSILISPGLFWPLQISPGFSRSLQMSPFSKTFLISPDLLRWSCQIRPTGIPQVLVSWGLLLGFCWDPLDQQFSSGGFSWTCSPRRSPDFERPMLLTALVLAGVKEDSLKSVLTIKRMNVFVIPKKGFS